MIDCVTERILIVEQDQADPNLWRYNLADAEGQLPETSYVLRADMTDSGPSVTDYHQANLWTTAILLVRQAGERTRIVYDLQPWRHDEPPEPPEPPRRGPEKPWERSTNLDPREGLFR